MASRVDAGNKAKGNVFPARYQKAKNERGYKATRTASLDTSQIATGQLYEHTVVVESKTCSEIPRRGECYGRGISNRMGQQDVSGEINSSLQGTSNIELNEQLQYLKSCIHLCLEEAFYLVYSKQSLTVYKGDIRTALTVENFWKLCCERVKNFHYKYVVYQYYRDKGWVPKPGAKFGVHFLLYKDGPMYYHSSYGVLVRSVMSASELTWQFVISFVRTMDSVNKGAIICDVRADEKELPSMNLLNPSCISKFIVEETLIHRWVPKQDRE